MYLYIYIQFFNSLLVQKWRFTFINLLALATMLVHNLVVKKHKSNWFKEKRIISSLNWQACSIVSYNDDNSCSNIIIKTGYPSASLSSALFHFGIISQPVLSPLAAPEDWCLHLGSSCKKYTSSSFLTVPEEFPEMTAIDLAWVNLWTNCCGEGGKNLFLAKGKFMWSLLELRYG